VQAPAISGHPAFERIYRVQMNTLELLVAFVPALLLAAQHWHALAVAGVGAVYLVGRVLYARAYVANPASRALGFVLSLLPVGVLLLGALLGALRSAV
jgi:glutathione S-transferase